MFRNLHDFLAGLSPTIAGAPNDGRRTEDRVLLRIDQVETWSRMRLAPMTAGALGALVAWCTLLHLVDARLLTGWLVAMLAIVALDIATGPPLRRYRPAKHEVERYHRQSVALCMLKGTAWGALVMMFYREAGVEGQVIITVLVTALLASTPFVFAAVPASAYAFTGPLLAQSVVMFALSGLREHAFELLLVLVYVVAFPQMLRRYSVSFAERSRALLKVDEQKHLISLLLNDFESHSGDWLWQTDADLRLRRVSDAFAKQSGVAIEDIVGKNADAFIAAHLTGDPDLDRGAMKVRAHLAAREPFRDLEAQLRFGQEDHWWSVTGTPSYGRDGTFLGYRGIGREITDRKRAERELTYLAHHDTLTGAGNRASFNNELARVQEAIGADRRFALILFDLDDFKAVNDAAGHSVGDEVLRTASRRIASSLPAKAFMARIGGDEFAAILELRPEIGADEVRDLANKLVAELNRPILLPEGTFRIGASVGVAVMPDDGREPGTVMQLADAALYGAKAGGKGETRLANAAEGGAYSHRKLLELDLRRAIDGRQFDLAFQPVIDSESGKTTAFEALARWRHPVFGDVSPAKFIPMAERSGLIHEIGRWALQEACRCAMEWPEAIRVAVNVSPRQFERDELADLVALALRESGLPPHRLEIEITESIYLDGIDRVCRTVSRLRALGVTIAMDDFGTGYSSLSSLQDVAFDRLKIDQSLARQHDPDKRTLSILRSIVAIGEALGLDVTAEGIETAEQAAFLRNLGCGSLQGYFFGAPMPFREIPAYLLNEATRAGKRFEGMDAQTSKASAAA